MSTAATVSSIDTTRHNAAAVLRRIFLCDLPVLDGMSWRRVGWVTFFAAAFSLYQVSWWIFAPGGGGQDASFGNHVEVFFHMFRRNLCGFFIWILMLTVLGNLPLTRLQLTLAVLAALLLEALISWPRTCILFAETAPQCEAFPSWESLYRFLPNGILGTFWIDGLIALIFFTYRHDRQVTQALHAAELARVDKQRRTLEADLRTMQAQVEPAFLLGTLEDVGTLYETDANTGERVLDELIVFLRAALPQLRETTSTLRKEFELARAYLNIAAVRLQDRLSFDIEAPESAVDVRMPPMVLLPLVERAMMHFGNGQGRATIHIASSSLGDTLRVTISESGPGFDPDRTGDGTAGIRARLSALYGTAASLVLRRRAFGATEAVMEIPYEAIDVAAAG